MASDRTGFERTMEKREFESKSSLKPGRGNHSHGRKCNYSRMDGMITTRRKGPSASTAVVNFSSKLLAASGDK